MLKRQIDIFFVALTFLTKIPSPSWVRYTDDNISKSLFYTPFIGLMVGGVAAITYFVLSYIFPISISIFLSMIVTILITGAFHEDGFADFCDGFGGGYNKEQILAYMKDSRLGSFGVIGMVGMLGLKYITLFEIEHSLILVTLVSGHSISRFISISVVYTHDYNGGNNLFIKKMTLNKLVISGLIGICPLLFYWDVYILLVFIPLVIVRLYFGYYLTKRIGGCTGDCLGAMQQISEVTFYLMVVGYGTLFN